jgi:transketolase
MNYHCYFSLTNQSMGNLIEQLELISAQVRRDIVRMVHGAKSGHPGGSLGCADILTALYFHTMKPDASGFRMDGTGEHVFFLSNGHISPAWYSVLARYGYFPIDELGTFRKLGTRLQGHPTPAEELPGIRVASGSLGQGLSVAIGMAQGKKILKDDRLVFCLHGDGELQEGQIWEAAMYAAANNMDNLIAIVDYNGKQIDGPTDNVLSLGDLKEKWKAFGWHVLECHGNKMDEMVSTLDTAVSETCNGKPVVILAHTVMGSGVDFMMGSHHWHGVAPNDDQLARALAQLPETLGDYPV